MLQKFIFPTFFGVKTINNSLLTLKFCEELFAAEVIGSMCILGLHWGIPARVFVLEEIKSLT